LCIPLQLDPSHQVLKSMDENLPKPRRWFRFSLRTVFVLVTLLATSLGLWSNWDYIPGTIRVDDNGYSHGTGTLRYFYEKGTPRITEHYRNGILTHSTWYRPDGSVVASSEFDVRSGGVGYYLYSNGNIRVKMTYHFSPVERLFIADGPATYYHVDGSIERTVEFRDGALQ
jgi:hypothetical protein